MKRTRNSSRTHGNRLSGFGTTQRSTAVSRPTCASALVPSPGSPVRGWSFPVNAWNQVLPRNPTYFRSSCTSLESPRPHSSRRSVDQSVPRYQVLRRVHGMLEPVRFCAAQRYRRARTCEPPMRSRRYCPQQGHLPTACPLAAHRRELPISEPCLKHLTLLRQTPAR